MNCWLSSLLGNLKPRLFTFCEGWFHLLFLEGLQLVVCMYIGFFFLRDLMAISADYYVVSYSALAAL